MRVSARKYLMVEKKERGDKYFSPPMKSTTGVNIEITVTIDNKDCSVTSFSNNKFNFDSYRKYISTSFEMPITTDPITIMATAIEALKNVNIEKKFIPEDDDIESIDDLIAEFDAVEWEKQRLVKINYYFETGVTYSRYLSHIDYLLKRNNKSSKGGYWWQMQFDGMVSDFGNTFPEKIRFITKRI